MIGLLERLGHRETVLGFLAWSVFAVIVMHVSAALLPAGIVHGTIPVYTAVATVLLGVMMGRDVARRGAGLAFVFVALNALPVVSAGAVVTALAPQLGWPLLGAPILLAAGAAVGILQQRRRDGYQNPGSAAVGASAAFAVFAFGAWFALGAMDARLAAAIRSLGSENNRTRIENVLASGDGRPCKP